MKTKLIFLLCLLPILSFAGKNNDEKYKQKLSTLIKKMGKSDTTKTGWLARAEEFKFMGEAKKNDWYSYYYAAYSIMNATQQEIRGESIDSLAGIAEQYLKISESLGADLSETNCVRALVVMTQIRVNMMERGMIYSRQVFESLGKAEKIKPENPRTYYIKALFLKNMPVSFGGGNKPSLSQSEKAKKIFDSIEIKETIEPSWGKNDNARLYFELSKQTN